MKVLKEKKNQEQFQEQKLIYARKSILLTKTKLREEQDKKNRLLKAEQLEREKLYKQICSEDFFWYNIYKYLTKKDLYNGLCISQLVFKLLSKTVNSVTLNLDNVSSDSIINLKRFPDIRNLKIKTSSILGLNKLSLTLMKESRYITLLSIDLSNVNICENGMKILCNAFDQRCCIKLKKLILKSNGLGIIGCKYLCDSLKNRTLTNLEIINLSGNNISDEGTKYLMDGLKSRCCCELREIDLRCII